MSNFVFVDVEAFKKLIAMAKELRK